MSDDDQPVYGPHLPTLADCDRAVQRVTRATRDPGRFCDEEVDLAWTFAAFVLVARREYPKRRTP